MIDINQVLQPVVDSLKERLGENLKCIVVTGSYGREEPRENSDIDTWIITSFINLGILKDIHQVVSSSSTTARIEPYCITEKEIANRHFKHGFSPVQCYLDGKVIFGMLPFPMCTNEEIADECGQILTFMLMSLRSVLLQNYHSDIETLRRNTYLVKWLIWALRYEALLRTGTYPKKTEELMKAVYSDVERFYIELIYKEYDFESTSMEVPKNRILETLHDCIDGVIERLNTLPTTWQTMHEMPEEK